MTSDFVHLHVHTEYSMLDGAARLADLFAETQRLGMSAVGLTSGVVTCVPHCATWIGAVLTSQTLR